MQKLLIVFLFVAFLSLNVSAQKQSSGDSKDKSQDKSSLQTQIPKGWKLIDLDDFSFILPESIKETEAYFTDVQVWRFENKEIELNITSGPYGVGFDSETRRFENKTESIEIDGVKGQFFSIDYTKPKSTKEKIEVSESDKEKPYLMAINFYHSNDDCSSNDDCRSFWIQYKKPEQSEIAEKILYSIKFKRK